MNESNWWVGLASSNGGNIQEVDAPEYRRVPIFLLKFDDNTKYEIPICIASLVDGDYTNNNECVFPPTQSEWGWVDHFCIYRSSDTELDKTPYIVGNLDSARCLISGDIAILRPEAVRISKTVMNEEQIRNDERLKILDRMGGDTYNLQSITPDVLYKELNDLSFMEYMSGIYSTVHHLYPKASLLLSAIAVSPTTEDAFMKLNMFLEGKNYNDKNN